MTFPLVPTAQTPEAVTVPPSGRERPATAMRSAAGPGYAALLSAGPMQDPVPALSRQSVAVGPRPNAGEATAQTTPAASAHRFPINIEDSPPMAGGQRGVASL